MWCLALSVLCLVPAGGVSGCGKVDAADVERFLLAHEALTRVSALYLDSLDGASPQQARRIRRALELAREKVPRRYGFQGYMECIWMFNEAPRNPANAQLFQTRGAKAVDAPEGTR